MDADLDLLLTAVYVTADDLLPEKPKNARRSLTDAEVVTLCVAQAIMGIPSDRRFLAVARKRLRHLFPRIPAQPGYFKRRRRLAETLEWLIGVFAAQSPASESRTLLVDSTPMECARSRERVKRSALSDAADYGYCRSHSRFFWGFRLHAIFAADGTPRALALTSPKLDECEVALKLLQRLPRGGGETLIGDQGYAGRSAWNQSSSVADARFADLANGGLPLLSGRAGVGVAYGPPRRAARCSGSAAAPWHSRPQLPGDLDRGPRNLYIDANRWHSPRRVPEHSDRRRSGRTAAELPKHSLDGGIPKMKLKPLGDRLIVQAIEEEETTASGLVLPDTAKEKPQKGKVLAAGDGRLDDDGKRIALDVKEGDEVLYSKYGGTEIKIDGEDLLVLRESDVLALVE
jgi:co-chaperonin GroES (HSP10)